MDNTPKQEMKGEHAVTFMIPAGNVFDLAKKKNILDKFALLDMERQAKLEALINENLLDQEAATLSPEDYSRVKQLISNPKALNALKNYWGMLTKMFA